MLNVADPLVLAMITCVAVFLTLFVVYCYENTNWRKFGIVPAFLWIAFCLYTYYPATGEALLLGIAPVAAMLLYECVKTFILWLISKK